MLYGSSENDLRKNLSEISPQTGTFSEQVIETFEYKKLKVPICIFTTCFCPI